MIKLLKEITKITGIKAFKEARNRHLNNLENIKRLKKEDPYNLNGMAFLPSDEGKTFIRTTIARREIHGVLFTNSKNITYTNVIKVVDEIKVVNGKATLISRKEIKDYISRPTEHKIANTVTGSLGFINRKDIGS